MLESSNMDNRKILFVEPFSGISGDMMIGALLDLGFDFEELRMKLALLPLKEYELSFNKCMRSGIRATQFDVQAGHSHHHRSFADIRQMIEASGLSASDLGKGHRGVSLSCSSGGEGSRPTSGKGSFS